MQRLLIWVAILVLTSLTSTPYAQEDDTAATSFAEGKKIFNAGKPAVALPLFRVALERTGSPNARLFVARCLRDTGKLVEAYGEMRKTLEDARELADENARYKATRDAAAAEIAKLDKRVGRVVVAVPDEIAKVTITIAGRLLPAEERGQPSPVLPGEIAIAVEADGYAPANKAVQLAAGQLETVVFTLTPLASDPTQPSAEPGSEGGADPGADDDTGGFGVVRGLGIGVAALGLGGVVAAAIVGSMVQSNVDQLDEECGGVRCVEQRHVTLIDETETLKLVTNIAAFGGGALLVAGGLMIIFGGPSDDSSASGRPILIPLPGGILSGYAVRF